MTTDLTRWNRAGLDRFRYVDGNAVTFLERLRQAESAEFLEQGGDQKWAALDQVFPEMPGESLQTRQQRWLAQYHDHRQDYAWEILRSLARSSHVLAEYVDAFANETFLGTASQWDSLRKLVAMLGYLPAPPASASTPLVLLLKSGRSGLVETGYAVKHVPEDGPPVIFETLEDLQSDSELDGLRCIDWNRSRQPMVLSGSGVTLEFPLEEPVEDLSKGGHGVLLIQTDSNPTLAFSCEISSVSAERLLLRIMDTTYWPHGVVRSQVQLLVCPQFRQAASLHGRDVIRVSDRHSLNAGDLVAWHSGGWKIDRVRTSRHGLLKLENSTSLPPNGEGLYRVAESAPQDVETTLGTRKRIMLPLGSQCQSAGLWGKSLGALGHVQTDTVGKYRYFQDSLPEIVYFIPKVSEPLTRVIESDPKELRLQGKPGKLSSGDWLLLQTGESLQAVKLEAVSENDGVFDLEVQPGVSDVDTVIGEFDTVLRPLDHDLNTRPVFETAMSLRSDKFSTMVLEQDAPWDLLVAGRRLVIASSVSAVEVRIKETDSTGGLIKVEPAIDGSEVSGSGQNKAFPRYDSMIYGNVVPSGHGLRDNEKVLGSGSASIASQAFILEVDDVSFVADRAFPTGVRADIKVSVDGRIWTQVPTLNWSVAEDHHYAVQLLENGQLKIVFGNGERGRLLPTGRNNVRAVYRRGSGLVGNLEPYSLEKEFKPHKLVDKPLQPLASSGGNDLEDVSSLRDNAPGSVLTLERAVSLADFSRLASAYSGVWQALAINARNGRRQRIEIVVIPAGGGPLGDLQTQLRLFLLEHATPGVDIGIISYREIRLKLKIRIQVDEQAFQPEVITQNVRTHLLETWQLRNGRLGQDVFRSQIIAAVESVTGVENCSCTIFPTGVPAGVRTRPAGDGAIRRVSADPDQVIFILDSPSDLIIQTRAYQPGNEGV